MISRILVLRRCKETSEMFSRFTIRGICIILTLILVYCSCPDYAPSPEAKNCCNPPSMKRAAAQSEWRPDIRPYPFTPHPDMSNDHVRLILSHAPF